MTPVLYTFRRCPYAIRARMALAASGADPEVREVELANKPAAFTALSPKGTVPVLWTAEGDLLEESIPIMLWALRRGDPFGWLPATPALEVRTHAMIAVNDGAFKQHLDRYKYATRYTNVDAMGEREGAARCLAPLEDWLSSGRNLLGEGAGLVDVAVFPFVRQFANVEPAWFEQRFPRLHRWCRRWQDEPLFGAVMRKLPAWREGDAGVGFRSAFITGCPADPSGGTP